LNGGPTVPGEREHYNYTAEDLAEDLADMDATMPRPNSPGA